MAFYFHLMSIIFFGFHKPIQCQYICEYIRDEPVCCSNFRMENGKCVACPLGSYGVNCSNRCPKGLYGEFCRHKCRCTEGEICDISYGCLDNSIEVISTSLFETEPISTNLQTTELTTEEQNTESKKKSPNIPFYLYLVYVGCASLFCILCMLLVCRNISHQRSGITGNNDATFEYERQEVAPQSGEQNDDEIMEEHEYIEISDVDPTYLEPCSRKSA